jgi:hypothetical protein
MQLGAIELTFNGLPQDIKKIMLNFARQTFKALAFGPVGSTAVSCTNMEGHLVPVTTSSVADQEVAIAHKLARVPRIMFPVLDPSTVGGSAPVFVVTQAADATYVYLSSADTDLSFHLYVE